MAVKLQRTKSRSNSFHSAFLLSQRGETAGNSSLCRHCQETICISMDMLWLEHHVTMESVCSELDEEAQRGLHTERRAPGIRSYNLLRSSQLRGIYRPTKKNIQILSLAFPAYSHCHPWDPTAKRRCGNKEEVYNLPGSCLKWKTPRATGRERGRRLVTEDFKYWSGHTFVCRDDTLTCLGSVTW